MNPGQTLGDFFLSFGRGRELLGLHHEFVFGSRDVVVTPALGDLRAPLRGALAAWGACWPAGLLPCRHPAAEKAGGAWD
jgi:hypothetical protein